MRVPCEMLTGAADSKVERAVGCSFGGYTPSNVSIPKSEWHDGQSRLGYGEYVRSISLGCELCGVKNRVRAHCCGCARVSQPNASGFQLARRISSERLNHYNIAK